MTDEPTSPPATTGDSPTEIIRVPADEPPAPESSPRRRGRLVAAVVGGLFALVTVVYLVDLLTTSGKVERNTTVAGVDIGGLTPDQAAQALTERAMPEYSSPISVDVHGVATPIDPQVAGLSADVAATVEAVGTRSANPFVRLTSFVTATDRPLVDQVDQAKLMAAIQDVADGTDVAPVEGAVRIEGTEVVVTAPVVGRDLDVPGAVDAVTRAWIDGGASGLDGLVLPVSSAPVRASAEQTERAAEQARTMLSAPLTLTAGGQTVPVPVADIAPTVTITPDDADGFVVGVDAAALLEPVATAIDATQSGPVDATVAIRDGAPVVQPSAQGRELDRAAVEAAVTAAVGTPNRTVELTYRLTDPSITTEQAGALGIKEVIGEFTTGGFAAASGENIRVVGEKVNGAIVQPHSTFGLNEFTGPRGTEQGYVPAAVIQEGALSTAVGGGISQFATTLYNAAYFAGMGDVTHTPHSFYISRYPAGREATVYDGEIELAFSNDFDTGVLIETIWTDSDITVRLWGTRHVEVESVSSDRFDYTSAPVIVKPYGTSCSPSGGSSGFSIVNTRLIRDLAGNEIRREDFTTVYNGQQNVICSPPPAAATTTAAPDAAATTPAAGG